MSKPIIAGPPRPQESTVGQDIIAPRIGPGFTSPQFVAPRVPVVTVPGSRSAPALRGPTIVPQAGPGFAVFVRHGGTGTPWMKHDMGPLPQQVAANIAAQIVPYSPAVGIGPRGANAPTWLPPGAIL